MHFAPSVCICLTILIRCQCQTVLKAIPNCFGLHARSHKTEVLPFQSGRAYHLYSSKEGIALTSTESKSSTQGCAYALTIPKDHDFNQLTVYVQKAEVKWKYTTSDIAQIVFISDKHQSELVSEMTFTYKSASIRNRYLNTKSWLGKASNVYMFINYTRTGNVNNLATLYLYLTITPTFTCVSFDKLTRGEYTSVRSVINSGWHQIRDLFNPGYVLCADTLKDKNTWSAPCVDYRLTCDRKFNCPPNTNTSKDIKMLTLISYPSDEHAKNLICYSPSANKIIILIIIFTVLNVIMLLAISYIGIIRHYSPMRFHRLQAQFSRFCCICCPRRYMSAMTGNFYFRNAFQRSSTNGSIATELPNSPPMYDTVRTAHPPANARRKCFCCCCCKKNEYGNAFAESGHHLPPSYIDSSEDVGVLPESVVKKMHSLHKNSQNKLRDKAIASIPRLKPAPPRNVSSAYSLREELRSALRHISNRLRNFVRVGLDIVGFLPNHQRINQVHPHPSTNQQEPNLPTYSEFITRDISGGLSVIDVERRENETHASPTNAPLNSSIANPSS